MEIPFTPRAKRVLELALEEARQLGHNYIGTEHLLLGLLREGEGVAARVLENLDADPSKIRSQVIRMVGESQEAVGAAPGAGGAAGGSKTPTLEEFGSDLTKQAEEAKLDPCIGRANEIIRVTQILGRRTKNNPCLIGEPGVGKSAIAEGLAQKIAANDVPETLEGKRMMTLDMGLLVAGTKYRGEFEERLKKLMDEVKADDDIILFIDEVHTLIGAGAAEGAIDAANILKPALARGELQCIGATTIDEYRKHIEKDPALERRFQPVQVPEPSVDEAIQILQGLRERYEAHHKLQYTDEAIEAAAKFAHQYISDRFLPDKAIDLIDEAIDEVHTLIGAGAAEGAIDAANILKPALARGELQCIGATTIDEYRKHIEKDPALERRFQPVQVPEPSVDEAIQILQGLRERYEAHHKLQYTDEAIEAAAKFAHQYISDRFLPDKAIDLIDEAGSRVRLAHAALPEEAKELDKELKALLKEKDTAIRAQDFEAAGALRDKEVELKTEIQKITKAKQEENKAALEAGGGEAGPFVTESDIAKIVASWTGIPVEKVSATEGTALMNMEETLHSRLIGQEEAVVACSRAIRRARTGLKNPNRPVASFIFSGPTGVGKSELAKSISAFYFGSEDAMVRLDMSEFMERHTVSKLIGSPPGYVGYSEGGQLTEAVRRRPYTLVLFDEVEKAHPDVFNMMLQILEDGRLTDSKGRVVDFKNTLIILTSNVGSSVIEKGGGGLGFQLNDDAEDTSYQRIKTLVNEELKNYFRPEFLNRLDEIIVFRQLNKSEVREIAGIMLTQVFKRLKEKEITLDVTDRFKDRLVDEGFNPTYGARPLRRAVMRLLEDNLAEKMLNGDIGEGSSCIMDVNAAGEITVLTGDGVTLNAGQVRGESGIA